MPRCDCRKVMSSAKLAKHVLSCPAAKAAALEAERDAASLRRAAKRARIEEPSTDASEVYPPPGTFESSPGFEDTPTSNAMAVEDTAGPSAVFVTRSGRATRRLWRVEDLLPDAPGAVLDDDDLHSGASDSVGPSLESHLPPTPRRLDLLQHPSIHHSVNRFGVRRVYKRAPLQRPTADFSLSAAFEPGSAEVAAVSGRTVRTEASIIHPFPNRSAFLYRYHFWVINKGKETLNTSQALLDTLFRPDFKLDDIKHVNFIDIDKKLSTGEGTAPWDVVRDGWRHTPVTIGIPTGQKATAATRRADAADARREAEAPLLPPLSDNTRTFEGIPFSCDFHHKSLLAEIVKIASTVPDLVWDPHLLEHVNLASPDASIDHMHGELYNSPAMVEEDLRLQRSAREPGCNLPRALFACMFHSDAMLVAQFGHLKVWPGYLFPGNQSKYVRGCPTAHAAHSIAYFPSLPDRIKDYIRASYKGKPPLKTLLTHLRRELFHACWELLLDDEFITAYFHGIKVVCADGVERRLYPRIFSYSADYPEKVLLATIRDKGKCPCPRCTITFDEIPALGTASDLSIRADRRRYDNQERRDKVTQARELIYKDGYVVNSARVEELLKPTSLVPTMNAFSKRLANDTLFDFYKIISPDQMHEGDIGVAKAVIAHLIRILDAHDPGLLDELNARFRQILPFATIRKFKDDVSDLSQLAARDYEDILQCSIPCFEGLLPEPHNSSIITLLYTVAYWQGCSKMRLHTDSSVKVFENVTAALGVRLRHFAFVVCPAFKTRESKREYQARMRASSSRSGASAAPATVPTEADAGRRARTFNLKTIKTHLIGYWPSSVTYIGSLDSTSTWAGELAHRHIKARYARTNYRNAEAQIVKIDILQNRLRLMAHELRKLGIDIPGETKKQHHDTSIAQELPPNEHHRIAREQHARNRLTLNEWRDKYLLDSSSIDLVELIQNFAKSARDESSYSARQIILYDDFIYDHKMARINYTSYDLRRDQDVIHPSEGRIGVLVSVAGTDNEDPWEYAWVLGVLHVNVLYPDSDEPQRLDALWVRWMERDITAPSGPASARLERLKFSEGSCGLVDPADIIRGTHYLPAFALGPRNEAAASLLGVVPADGWKYYYMNRFVDRDMLVRLMGLGVGHLRVKACRVEIFPVPEESSYPDPVTGEEPLNGESRNLKEGEGTEEGEDGDEDELDEDEWEERDRRSFEDDLEDGFERLVEDLGIGE